MRKGRESEHMFVKTITVGGRHQFKKPDIKGRGRCGIIRVPECNMRVTLEEKSGAEFFKMSMKGETPPGVSAILRRMLYQNKASFDQVKATSFMLTSKGRYYRRVQFRRLVQLI